MNIQHNVALALDWLMPLFDEQLLTLSAQWQDYQDGKLKTIVPDMAESYHQISGALRVANMLVFSDLSMALSALTLHISKQDDQNNADSNNLQALVQVAVHSHELFYSELKKYFNTDNYHHYLLVTSADEIAALLPDTELVLKKAYDVNKIKANNAYLSKLISLPTEAEETLILSTEQKEKIKQAWRHHYTQLIADDSNSSDSIEQLHKMSQFVWRSCQLTLAQRIWYFTSLWLECLPNNEQPKPHQYGRILAKLETLLSQSLDMNTTESNHTQEVAVTDEAIYESLVAEICIQINLLNNTNDKTDAIINQLKRENFEDNEFFDRILKELEQLIFKLNNPEVVIEPLTNIKQQLDRRGWVIYVTYLEIILSDLKESVESPEIYSQLQWQVERQLQELYGSIFAMKTAIEEKIGQGRHPYTNKNSRGDSQSQEVDLSLPSNSKILRQVRISIETIKTQFNQYITSHNLAQLPNIEFFSEMSTTLAELDLSQVNEVVNELSKLFQRFHDHQLTQINWTIVGATADSIVEFEVFLDQLAQQIFNTERLSNVSHRIDEANSFIDQFLANSQPADEDTIHPQPLTNEAVIRYDDSGEIAPIDSMTPTSNNTIPSTENNSVNDKASDDLVNPATALVDETTITDPNLANSNTDENEIDENEIHASEQDDSESDNSTKPLESEALALARESLKDDEFDMDEDIREIFIEEAAEVLESMDENLPNWQDNPENLDILKEIRRGFHTLKGSGRMVGAHNVGEMSWAVEKMLNRVLDNTLPVNDDLVEFIIDTKRLIPTLVDDYANQQVPSIDPAITVLKAHNLLANKAINDGLPSSLLSTEQSLPATNSGEQTLSQDNTDDAMVTTNSLSESSPAIENDTEVDIDNVTITATEDAPDDSMTAHHLFKANTSSDFVIPETLQPFWEEANQLPEDDQSTDDEIKEIFIEEADEVLETIAPLYQQWSEDTNDSDTLTEIRRGFHTLKGSGRMVGANATGELAWSIENMLNRVIDHTINVDNGMVQLTQDVIDAYPELIELFEHQQPYPDILTLWVSSANAYSKGLGDDFNYQSLLNTYLVSHDSSKSSDERDSDSDSDSIHHDGHIEESVDNIARDKVDALGSIHADEVAPVSSENDQNISEEEREFIDIFIEEAKERLEVINKFVNKNLDSEEVEVSDEIVRAFHTLRGASGAESLQVISDISSTIENNLTLLQHNEACMNGQHIEAISHSAELISDHLHTYEQQNQFDDKYATDTNNELESTQASQPTKDQEVQTIQNLFDDSQPLPANTPTEELNVAKLVDENIDELLDAEWELEDKLSGNHQQIIDYTELLALQAEELLSRVGDSKKFKALLIPLQEIYQNLSENPELVNNDNLLVTLLAAHEQLTGLFDSLAGSMSLRVDEQVIQSLYDLLDDDITDSDSSIASTATPTHTSGSTSASTVETTSIETPTLEAETTLDTDTEQEVQQENQQENTTKPEFTEPEEIPEPVEYEDITTEAELLEIFLEEAQELEADITNSFGVWRQSPTDLNALKELQRHLHTIKGGARMAGISSIGNLTHEMETIYEKFVNQSMNPSEPWLNVMQSAQDTLSMQIEFVNSNHQSFFTNSMIEQLQAYMQLDELPIDARLKTPVLDTEEAIETVTKTDQKESEQSGESLDDIEKLFNAMVNESWHGEQPDPDILAVFLEEADELIESSSQHLQTFRSNTGDIKNLQALQRELHTIKGGARMVGADGIADVAHEMETVYEDLGARRLPATKKVLQLLATCHDWCASSIYLLKNNINPPTPLSLIESLQAFHKNPDNLRDVPVISLQRYSDAIAEYEAYQRTMKGVHDTTDMPPMIGDFGDFEETSDISNEMIRVSSGVMEQMINLSGESSINRARIDMGMTSLTNSIEEMGTTVQRLADQLRRMDIELEAQVRAQIEDEALLENEDFDPLEMDQYSSLNQLSKSLSESASDLLDIKSTLLEKTRDSENLLLQLSRTQRELQDSLMSSRMVPFSRLTPRLQRIVRQTANEVQKQVELTIINADDEMDRTILERITSPLEHMLRNSVDHGIESASDRQKLGKQRVGQVELSISRQGGEMVIQLSDDGNGIDVQSVRKKAISQGLIDPNDDSLTDTDIMQYIFNAGLSTTKKVTQISGRGVGMDVVRSEIRQLGGTVSVESTKGSGSCFTMRVPLTVAVSDALIVRAADRHFAIPLVQIERVEQVNAEALFDYYQSNRHTFDISGHGYRLRYLNEILTGSTINDLISAGNNSLPVIIIKNQTGQSLALQVDEIVGSRIELVVKPLGKQLSHLSGVSAATIMGDGSVMLILDLMALVRDAPVRRIAEVKKVDTDTRKKVLVIDDSVTVRKVTSRFLEREGFDAHVAKDGVDALEILQEFTPDLMLLDIEMPRLDGFEVATQVRHNERLKDIPIIMITSRTGDKHREHALEIGVNDYLGKPFQETVLLERIIKLLGTTVMSGANE